MIKEGSLKRSGFSLIELVFSIIIIAISLMSIPMLMGESNKANQYSLIQESVMAARTKLGNILTFQWDDNSTIISATNALEGLRVIDTLNGNIDLNRSVGTAYRVGHPNGVDRRKFDTTTNPVLAKTIGLDAGDALPDDIDDFDGTHATLIASGAAGVVGAADYLGATELNITTTVRFLRDRPNGGTYQGTGARTLSFDFNTANVTDGTAAQSTNIKMIELSVANAFSDEPFIFRAFSSNLGGLKRLHSRDK